jgi:hypothetical protein
MFIKLALGIVAMLIAMQDAPRDAIAADVLTDANQIADDSARHGIRLAQQGAPDSTRPNTNKPPAGAAEIPSSTMLASGNPDDLWHIEGGTVKSIKDGILDITFDGMGAQRLKLLDDVSVTVVSRAQLRDIKPGVGLGQGPGSNEVHIFPPGTRTSSVVIANDGRKIIMGDPDKPTGFKYEIAVNSKTKVIRYDFTGKEAIRPGARIYANLPKQLPSDSAFEVQSVAVAPKGITPGWIPRPPSTTK